MLVCSIISQRGISSRCVLSPHSVRGAVAAYRLPALNRNELLPVSCSGDLNSTRKVLKLKASKRVKHQNTATRTGHLLSVDSNAQLVHSGRVLEEASTGTPSKAKLKAGEQYQDSGEILRVTKRKIKKEQKGTEGPDLEVLHKRKRKPKADVVGTAASSESSVADSPAEVQELPSKSFSGNSDLLADTVWLNEEDDLEVRVSEADNQKEGWQTVVSPGEFLLPQSRDNIPEQDRELFLEVERARLLEQAKRASNRSTKSKYNPESELRFVLDHCSKFGDVSGALAIYDKFRNLVKFDQYNYNVLVYLCSSAALGVLRPMKRSKQRPDYEEDPDEIIEEDGVCIRGNMAGLVGRNTMGLSEQMMELCLRRGLEICENMLMENVQPNEATFTAMARLAVAKLDGDLAFEIVKRMAVDDIAPKLRSYGPALYVYFKNNDPATALEVYEHMLAHGVQPEEAELEILLELNSRAGLESRVYELLHKLRDTVRDVSPSTVNVIERWFGSEHAAKATSEYLVNSEEVKAAVIANGGGWHGLGWLGKGDWKLRYSQLDEAGRCLCCREKMVAIDIDPQETESFADCLAGIAAEREKGASFAGFKNWLERHGPYDTVIDGANVGFFGQRDGLFSFQQLNAVVTNIRRSSGKWPLIVLHHKRTTSGPARLFQNQQLLKQWSKEGALYSSPVGSNDDWYWLYAAVRCKALLVSNDEMRDHTFQLLGRDFFPKWKERHQIRFRVGNRGPQFFMPPPYSIVIQESETGSLHVPVAGGDDISMPRSWVCITRPQVQRPSSS